MNLDTITYQTDERLVAWVSLNQPDKHNAMSTTMMRELIEVFSDIGRNDEIRAVVLSAKGHSFCAGGDLNWMQANLDKPRADRIAESQLLADLFEAVDHCPKIVVGRINGQAYGGGVGLISVCDIAIGVETAKFALTEVRLGLVPANIMPYVLRKVGEANLRRLALNAVRIDGVQAASLGLLDRAVPESDLDEALEQEISAALAAAPNAIATTKRLIAELDQGGLADPNRYLTEALADAWEHEEAQAGIRAFFAKQPAPWKL